jgi:MoxR-like ATPase
MTTTTGNRAATQTAFILAALKITGGSPVVSREQVLRAAKTAGVANPAWLTNNPEFREGRGSYRIPADKIAATGFASGTAHKTHKIAAKPAIAPVADTAPVVMGAAAGGTSLVDATLSLAAIAECGDCIPHKDPLFVAYGHYDTVKRIIGSSRWAPSYVVGPSGCGKTYAYQQACADLKREYYEVQVTTETTEDDLLGGFRLINGETKFIYGPVALAMMRGGFLVLDEIDQATSKVMCLQQVLNGKPVFLKKINQWVKPATGFNVGATANTKGNGDDTGRFVGANPLNVAFRDRLSGMTFVADYPTPAVEKKILNKAMQAAGVDDAEFAALLVDWAGMIRKTNREGGLDETMTTRRLVQIAQNLSILGERTQAVELGVNIYDEITREAMLSLFQKIDPATAPKSDTLGQAPEAATTDANSTKCPF